MNKVILSAVVTIGVIAGVIAILTYGRKPECEKA